MGIKEEFYAFANKFKSETKHEGSHMKKETESDIQVDELKPGEFGDIVAIRSRSSRFKVITNIPHFYKTSDSYSWGYSGTGPHDFAINILHHFTNGDEVFCRYHHGHLVGEVISKMPEPGRWTAPRQLEGFPGNIMTG